MGCVLCMFIVTARALNQVSLPTTNPVIPWSIMVSFVQAMFNHNSLPVPKLIMHKYNTKIISSWWTQCWSNIGLLQDRLQFWMSIWKWYHIVNALNGQNILINFHYSQAAFDCFHGGHNYKLDIWTKSSFCICLWLLLKMAFGLLLIYWTGKNVIRSLSDLLQKLRLNWVRIQTWATALTFDRKKRNKVYVIYGSACGKRLLHEAT